MSWISLFLILVNVTMVLADSQRRALHDRIAGTRVLQGRTPKREALFARAGIV